MIFRSYSAKIRYVSDQCYELVPIDFCIYCGDCWEVYDHVPPVSAWCVNTRWAFKYPSCADCNSILNALPIRDIRVRRYFILKKLFKRYSKIIKMPNWETNEVKEVKGIIKSLVKCSTKKKKHLLRRIDFLTENYLAPERTSDHQ